eukprot:TRINITY_DN584_c1_g2_i2.p1 TRINITY_DN584_c1_g2~~TRINITY_DN584_c1_g2_i2.p1  ORF type:complete len:348 (-),score=177.31 TRINITY_DN584_c1_g2_i2:97-1140(-)
MANRKPLLIALPGLLPGPQKPLSKIVFDKYDKDKSGSIDKNELKEICYEMGHHLSKEELDLALEYLDSDGNGTIEYEEFVVWWKKNDRFVDLELDDARLAIRQTASKIFRRFDSDASGVIDSNEFSAFHQHLTESGLTDRPLNSCFAELDENHDGKVQFNEFIRWLKEKESNLTVRFVNENGISFDVLIDERSALSVADKTKLHGSFENDELKRKMEAEAVIEADKRAVSEAREKKKQADLAFEREKEEKKKQAELKRQKEIEAIKAAQVKAATCDDSSVLANIAAERNRRQQFANKSTFNNSATQLQTVNVNTNANANTNTNTNANTNVPITSNRVAALREKFGKK